MTTVYFVTNRNRSKKRDEVFGERFNEDGPQFYRVGRAEMDHVSGDWDESYKVRSVEVLAERKPNPETGRGGLLGSSRLLREIRHEAQKGRRDVIVLIPGFANTFESSLQRAAQIKQRYLIEPPDGGEPYEPHMILFSWPSNGRTIPPWEYHSDRDDAAASGVAAARFFMRFWDVLNEMGRCDQPIHIVAHSMGNWAFRHAILGINNFLGDTSGSTPGRTNLPKVFANVFLMAADEDDDALEDVNKMGLLPQLARFIHVYHSADDGALTISDSTKFNPDRLGTNGPRTFSGLTGRVASIDCSKVDDTETLHANHQYYRIRKEVVDDVRAVLSGRFRADEIDKRVTVESGRRYRIEP